MEQIKFGEVKVGIKARELINHCLDTNWLTMGRKVKTFEKSWEKLFGYKHNVAMANGTCGVTAACMALYDYGAKPGDYIVCPALTFCATWNAIRFAGFVPLPVDVELDTLQININKLPDFQDKSIAGVCAVNLMGRTCDLDMLQGYAKNLDVPLIVDNCEAYGATLDGKYSLEYGDFEVTSFYTAHILQSIEGALVSCNSQENADILKSIRSHGRQADSDYFDHVRFGGNFKPSDLHFCIGLANLDGFWDRFATRKQNCDYLLDKLHKFQHQCWFVTEDARRRNAPHAFSITLKPGYEHLLHKITQSLKRYKIDYKRNFGAITQHKAFEHYNYSAFPNAEWIGTNGIHVGVHEFLTEENLNRIVTAISEGFL